MTKRSYLIRQLVSAVLAVVFFLAALSFLLPGRALDATPTLKVYAQYWADPDSATLLGEYSREQLDARIGDIKEEGSHLIRLGISPALSIRSLQIQALNTKARFLAHLGLPDIRQRVLELDVSCQTSLGCCAAAGSIREPDPGTGRVLRHYEPAGGQK